MARSPSIRTQLTRRLLAGTCAILILANAVIGVFVRSALIGQFDRMLATKVHALTILTSREQRWIEVDTDPVTAAESDDDPLYFQAALENGPEIIRSESLAEVTLIAAAPASRRALYRNLRLPNGHRGRMLQVVMLPRVDEETGPALADAEGHEQRFIIPHEIDEKSARVVLAVAQDRTDLDAGLCALYLMLAAVDVLVTAGIAGVIYRSVGAGFAPVDALNQQIENIDPDALSARVHLLQLPQELESTVRALNEFLERLQRAFVRERRFTSDVAHELRTPVAEMRAACEIGVRWPADTEAVRDFFNDLADIAAKMELIVSHLLALARCESGAEPVILEPVPLALILRACWADTAPQAEREGMRAEFDIDHELVVVTDRQKLAMILRNLTDNAVNYSVPGSVLHMRAVTSVLGIELVVANPTSQVTRADLEHMTARFWRKDTARSESRHAGLGLSIVKALSDLIGIGFRLGLTDGGVLEARLLFPAAPAR